MAIKKNKIALITGSGKRLGKDIALSLADSGYDIILHYFSSPVYQIEKTLLLIKEKKVNVCAFKADLSKVSEIKSLFGKIKKRFKSIDVLINNSAIFKNVDLFNINEKIFNKFIDTNLKSTLFCSIEAAKIMKGKGNTNHIINISSLGGILNWVDHIPYSLAKISVIKLTELMAKRLAPNILVNAIAPGTIVIENDKNINVKIDDINKYPLKKFGKANDITSLVNYLVNKNSFITGHTFIVDGGRSL